MTYSDNILTGGTTRDEARVLFAHTMGLVAITAAFFAGGAYLGRNLSSGAGLLFFIASFVCLLGMNFAIRTSEQLAVGLLFAFGVLIGLAVAPTIAYYASTDPKARLGGGRSDGALHRGLRRGRLCDPARPAAARAGLFWALLALIVFGIVTIFVSIPDGALIYAILGLVIFAGFTMFDFQRLRKSKDIRGAPLLAASIFLDILNVFLFFLSIFGRRN